MCNLCVICANLCVEHRLRFPNTCSARRRGWAGGAGQGWWLDTCAADPQHFRFECRGHPAVSCSGGPAAVSYRRLTASETSLPFRDTPSHTFSTHRCTRSSHRCPSLAAPRLTQQFRSSRCVMETTLWSGWTRITRGKAPRGKWRPGRDCDDDAARDCGAQKAANTNEVRRATTASGATTILPAPATASPGRSNPPTPLRADPPATPRRDPLGCRSRSAHRHPRRPPCPQVSC